MTDFLKAMPSVTRDEYMWKWTIPQIKLAMYDYTHVEYHTDNDKDTDDTEATVINSADDLKNDLGFPIFKNKEK